MFLFWAVNHLGNPKPSLVLLLRNNVWWIKASHKHLTWFQKQNQRYPEHVGIQANCELRYVYLVPSLSLVNINSSDAVSTEVHAFYGERSIGFFGRHVSAPVILFYTLNGLDRPKKYSILSSKAIHTGCECPENIYFDSDSKITALRQCVCI